MAGPDFETNGGSEFVPSLEKNVREQQAVLYSSILRAQHSSGFPFQSGDRAALRRVASSGGGPFFACLSAIPSTQWGG
jgi:hypothetical protein